MSISTLRNDYKLRGITMRYEDGGKVQVFKMGDKEVKFGPDAPLSEIAAAFQETK
jgi:hypothetical protein